MTQWHTLQLKSEWEDSHCLGKSNAVHFQFNWHWQSLLKKLKALNFYCSLHHRSAFYRSRTGMVIMYSHIVYSRYMSIRSSGLCSRKLSKRWNRWETGWWNETSSSSSSASSSKQKQLIVYIILGRCHQTGPAAQFTTPTEMMMPNATFLNQWTSCQTWFNYGFETNILIVHHQPIIAKISMQIVFRPRILNCYIYVRTSAQKLSYRQFPFKISDFPQPLIEPIRWKSLIKTGEKSQKLTHVGWLWLVSLVINDHSMYILHLIGKIHRVRVSVYKFINFRFYFSLAMNFPRAIKRTSFHKEIHSLHNYNIRCCPCVSRNYI
jgi:hypothetical protein